MTFNRIEPGHMIGLGALECASSCIMTAAAAFGFNPQHFMLHYWDINYVNGNLLSSRVPWYLDLRTCYGIRMTLREEERPDGMIASIRAGHLIMFRCQASALSFFPGELLVHDAGGFDHYCLLADYDPAARTYRVVDPIASYIGVLTADEVAAAAADAGTYAYYELARPDALFVPPRPEELLAFGAAYNYDTICRNPSGLRAFDEFADDLAASASWKPATREAWLQANTITISSTIKIRRRIWESYAALHVMNEHAYASFEAMAKAIVTLWTRLNLSLIKYKHRGQPETVASCRQLLRQLHDAEERFVREMHALGSRIAHAVGKGDAR